MTRPPQQHNEASPSSKALVEKPQLLTLVSKALSFTIYDVKWVPCSARFVVMGQMSRGTGALQVYELDGGQPKLLLETEKKAAIKCGTFGASTFSERHIACGDFDGVLAVHDLTRTDLPVYSVKAHDSLVNCVDGAGGYGMNTGPPELVTGSRDGSVKVWDVRQKDVPVATMAPSSTEASKNSSTTSAPDCWTVAFGDSYTDSNRMVCAGYANGDVKMFDLRTMSVHWEDNVRNGVCAVEFDRRDIRMNKLVVAGLESSLSVFDLRTRHPTAGYAKTVKKTHDQTVWTVKHLPQNRDIFIASGSSGTLELYKYVYPESRSRKDSKKEHDMGVPGTLESLNTANVGDQPVHCFDWSPDKRGLCVFAAFDQQVRIGMVTKLDKF